MLVNLQNGFKLVLRRLFFGIPNYDNYLNNELLHYMQRKPSQYTILNHHLEWFLFRNRLLLTILLVQLKVFWMKKKSVMIPPSVGTRIKWVLLFYDNLDFVVLTMATTNNDHTQNG